MSKSRTIIRPPSVVDTILANRAEKAARDLRDFNTKALDGFIHDRPDSRHQLGYLSAVLEYARTFGCDPTTFAMAAALEKVTAAAMAECDTVED